MCKIWTKTACSSVESEEVLESQISHRDITRFLFPPPLSAWRKSPPKVTTKLCEQNVRKTSGRIALDDSIHSFFYEIQIKQNLSHLISFTEMPPSSKKIELK